jgi:hypothetical protein
MEVSSQLHALAALSQGKEPLGIHLIGGWVYLRAGLDAVAKRKIPSPRRESNPGHPARHELKFKFSRLRMVWTSQYQI